MKTVFIEYDRRKTKQFRDNDIYIDQNVKYKSKPVIGYRVTIFSNCKLGENVIIERGVTIGQNCTIGDNVHIKQFSKIGDNVSVGDNITIEAQSRIEEGTTLKDNKLINGTKDKVTYCGSGEMKIGCIQQSIDWWLSNYEVVGKENGYTKEQIEEYHKYMLLMKEYDTVDI